MVGNLKSLMQALVAAVVIFGANGAQAAPVFQLLSPIFQNFNWGVGADFTLYPGSGLATVTADVQNVDPNSGTSGCDPGDFAGFAAGRVALIQDGGCPYILKAINATAAGASAVLVFNDVASGAEQVPFAGAVPIPSLFLSFFAGTLIAQFPDAVVRIVVDEILPNPGDTTNRVSEPTALALLALGLPVLLRLRRRSG